VADAIVESRSAALQSKGEDGFVEVKTEEEAPAAAPLETAAPEAAAAAE
jgi:hypothetical protein